MIGLDAISGATVTVIAREPGHDALGAAVARQTGILAGRTEAARRRFTAVAETLDWAPWWRKAACSGCPSRRTRWANRDTGQPFIELWFGYLNAPDIGRRCWATRAPASLMAQLKPGEHAIFIVAQGTGSFKGSGFVRGGIYDRVQVRQGRDTFTFRDLDYLNLYGLAAAGAPRFQRVGDLHRALPGASAAPTHGTALPGQPGGPRNRRAQLRQLRARILAAGRATSRAAGRQWRSRSRRGSRCGRRAQSRSCCSRCCWRRSPSVYALRDQLTRRATRKNKWPVNVPKYSAWVASIGFVGFGLMAQPSITQVLTWFHALLFHWSWELFLSDPFIFLFWFFIIVTVFVWGRGLFCGWLCPFGSLSELLTRWRARSA